MKRKDYFPPETEILPLTIPAGAPLLASGYAEEGKAGGTVPFDEEDEYDL